MRTLAHHPVPSAAAASGETVHRASTAAGTPSDLKVEGMSKHFRDVVAVRDVSFEAQPGEFISFLGPSGCGKTTTLSMIAGFQDVTSGAVYIQAFDGVTTTSFATGVTVGTIDWHIYRIDANNLTDVKFFIDGVQVNTTGLVNFAATGTLAVLQPYLACYKPGGTGVATLTIDYVRACMNRQ